MQGAVASVRVSSFLYVRTWSLQSPDKDSRQAVPTRTHGRPCEEKGHGIACQERSGQEERVFRTDG
jgi:hypothetical protein